MALGNLACIGDKDVEAQQGRCTGGQQRQHDRGAAPLAAVGHRAWPWATWPAWGTRMLKHNQSGAMYKGMTRAARHMRSCHTLLCVLPPSQLSRHTITAPHTATHCHTPPHTELQLQDGVATETDALPGIWQPLSMPRSVHAPHLLPHISLTPCPTLTCSSGME